MHYLVSNNAIYCNSHFLRKFHLRRCIFKISKKDNMHISFTFLKLSHKVWIRLWILHTPNDHLKVLPYMHRHSSSDILLQESAKWFKKYWEYLNDFL